MSYDDDLDRAMEDHFFGNDCPECNGSGSLVVQTGWSRFYERCPVCDGSGVIESPTPEEEPTE